MIGSFKERRELKRILKDNAGKITLTKGPAGHFWFDANKDVAFEDLSLPNSFKYKQHLFDDNGGGQFLIIDENGEQLGRINTYSGKSK